MNNYNTCTEENKILILHRLRSFISQSKSVTSEILAWNTHSSPNADHFRSTAIRWMKEASKLAGISTEARDTSMQLFDRYMGLAQVTNIHVLEYNRIQIVAAASILLSSKIHEVKSLSPRNFPHIKAQDLVKTEREILHMLQYLIFPSASPAMFIRLCIQLAPISDQQKGEIIFLADRLVGTLWEDPRATMYAPSTIGLAALIVALSNLGIDGGTWLTQIPSQCLLGVNDRTMSIDVEECLAIFNQLRLYIHRPPCLSPECRTKRSGLMKRILFSDELDQTSKHPKLSEINSSLLYRAHLKVELYKE